MGIQINGNTNNINAGIGSLSIEDIHELDVTGIVTAAQFKLLDNAKAVYGSSADMEIYHNATNSLIQNGTGSLQIITTTGDLFLRGQDSIKFNTAGNNERLTITSTGEIKQYGFTGTSDTGSDDLVLGNTTGGVNRGMTIWSNSSQNGSIAFADNDSNFRGAVQYIHNGDILRFLTAGDERLRITSTGQLLISESSTDTTLNNWTGATINIKNTSNTDNNKSVIYFSNSAGGTDSAIQAIHEDADGTGTARRGFLSFGTSGSNSSGSVVERLRIDGSGRVLIGTTDPGGGNADDLTVATSGNTGITIRSGTSNTGNIFFSDATSGAAQYAGAVEFHHSDNSLNLNVGNTAIVRIVKDSTTPAVGVGILPQAGQYNGWSVLQVGESAALTSNRTTADTNQTELSNNSYLNSNASAYKYHHADEATRYVQSHGRHTFYSAASGSADANITFSEVMKIDASGRVTKPLTPAFLAYHHGYDVNYTPNQTLPYQFTVFNTGNHYNTSNSTFTAPVAGRYLFSANANGNYSSSYSGIPRAYWKINGSNPGNAIHLRGPDSTDQGLEQRSQTVIFNLAANDTVKIVVGQNQWDLFGANSFTGYLIG